MQNKKWSSNKCVCVCGSSLNKRQTLTVQPPPPHTQLINDTCFCLQNRFHFAIIWQAFPTTTFQPMRCLRLWSLQPCLQTFLGRNIFTTNNFNNKNCTTNLSLHTFLFGLHHRRIEKWMQNAISEATQHLELRRRRRRRREKGQMKVDGIIVKQPLPHTHTTDVIPADMQILLQSRIKWTGSSDQLPAANCVGKEPLPKLYMPISYAGEGQLFEKDENTNSKIKGKKKKKKVLVPDQLVNEQANEMQKHRKRSGRTDT